MPYVISTRSSSKTLRFLRQTKRRYSYILRTKIKWCKPVQGGAGGVCMPIARRSAEEYPGATRRCASLLTSCECMYAGELHHAALYYWARGDACPSRGGVP